MPLAHSHEIPSGSARPYFWPLLLGVTMLFASGWQFAPAAPFRSWIDLHVWGHFFVFGLLATLILRCFGSEYSRPRAIVGAFLITAAFGLGDEVRQAFNPVRDFSVADAVIDCLGAATALAAYRCWPTYRRLLESRIPATGRREADNGWQPRRELKELKPLARKG